MELSHDWKGFQSFFLPPMPGKSTNPNAHHAVYGVTEGDYLVVAYAENEDLSDWAGAKITDLVARFPNRELLLLPREKMDHWRNQSRGLPHFYAQLGALKKSVLEFSKTGAGGGRVKEGGGLHSRLTDEHFLLNGMRGWWKRWMPESYCVYVQLEGKPSRRFLVRIRNGEVDGFHEPDLNSLDAQRRKDPQAVVKYLSEREMLPVHGIFAQSEDWNAWSCAGDPWTQIEKAIRQKRLQLAPQKRSIRALVALRAYLGV